MRVRSVSGAKDLHISRMIIQIGVSWPSKSVKRLLNPSKPKVNKKRMPLKCMILTLAIPKEWLLWSKEHSILMRNQKWRTKVSKFLKQNAQGAGKACNLIVHNRSQTNVASQTLKWANLPTSPYAQPYALQLAKRSNKLKVTKQSLICFSIGKKPNRMTCFVTFYPWMISISS